MQKEWLFSNATLTNKKQLKPIFEFYNHAMEKEWLFSNATMTK
jgi:hypothetical protein